MSQLPQISCFMPFRELEVSSASDSQQCLWYLPAQNRRCKYPLNQEDRLSAFAIRSGIKDNHNDSTALDRLKEYAIRKYCNRVHRDMLIKSHLHEALAQKWLRELRLEILVKSRLPNLPASNTGNENPIIMAKEEPEVQLTTIAISTRLRPRESRSREQPVQHNVDPSASRFRPRRVPTNRAVSSQLLAPLTSKSKAGSIYLFTRESALDHVKIGYTGDSVQARLKGWQKQCGYTPILLGAFEDVPHVRKVESLIHYQLADAWRVENICQKCYTQHQEWFEINSQDAIKVAGQWVKWMREAQPYNAHGHLKEIWMDELSRLELNNIPVTAETLLSAHRRRSRAAVAATAVMAATPTAKANINGTPQRNTQPLNSVTPALKNNTITTTQALFADHLTAEPDLAISQLQIQTLASCLVTMLTLAGSISQLSALLDQLYASTLTPSSSIAFI